MKFDKFCVALAKVSVHYKPSARTTHDCVAFLESLSPFCQDTSNIGFVLFLIRNHTWKWFYFLHVATQPPQITPVNLRQIKED